MFQKKIYIARKPSLNELRWKHNSPAGFIELD